MSFGSLVEKFRSVALDRLEQMNLLLVELERHPEDEEATEELLREIHTLKGEAKMMGFADVNLVAHQSEHILSLITERNFDIDQEAIDVAFEGLDITRQLLTKAAGSSDAPVDLSGFVERVTALRGRYEGDVEAVDVAAVTGDGESDSDHGEVGREEEERGQKEEERGEEEEERGEEEEVDEGGESQESDESEESKESEEPDEPVEPEKEEPPGASEGDLSQESWVDAASRTGGSPEGAGQWSRSQNSGSTRTRIDSGRRSEAKGASRGGDDDKRATDSDRLLRLQASGTLRVDLQKLEGLGDLVGEVLLMSRRLNYELGDLEVLRSDLRGWMESVEDDLPLKAIADLRNLVHRLDDFTTRSREGTYRISERTSRLDDEVRTLRHVPLAQVMSHYPRAVRDLAREQGKRVRLTHSFGSVEVDRLLLSALSEPMLHLVRNAVDHGIEGPEERRKAGKEPEAEIQLVAEYVGESIRVVITDDGRGIDPKTVRKKAISRGLLEPEQSEAMSDQEALALIFEPGFSTRDNVSDVSGRGIGMDVVRRQITELGGYIEIESEVGQGTSITLMLPVSSAVSEVLMVDIVGRTFALAAKEVVRVTAVAPNDLIEGHGGVFIDFDGEMVALHDWTQILGGGSARPADETMTLLILRRGSQRVAVRVEAVLGEREAMSQPFDDFLGGVRLCRGVALTDAGEIVPLLNVSELFARAQRDRRLRPVSVARPRARSRPKQSAPELRHTVLVVEDSEITRDMVSQILRENGYRCIVAEDGHQGWQVLDNQRVDLVVTDIQMPRMDGLELLQRIRSSQRLANLPVVILTTLGDPKDKARALDLGADGYLVKLDFQESELLEVIRRYLAA